MLQARGSTGSRAPLLAPQFPLADLIERIGRLPPPLLSTDARHSLRSVTAQLPAALSNRFYFECRLGAGTPRVDVVMCVDPRNRDVLARHNGLELPPLLRAHPVWSGVVELFNWWARGTDPGARGVTQVWLEIDALPDNTIRPVPCVFLAFPKGSRPADVRAATLGGLGLLRSAPFDATIAEAVEHAIAGLPSSARVAYSGLMCSRTMEAVRLCITNLKRDQILRYLPGVKWPGNAADVADAMQAVVCDTVPAPAEIVALLHVDVGVDTGPRLGLEICFDRATQLRGTTRERDLLDRLCAAGLCSESKRDALLQWPGHSLEYFAHERGRQSLVVRRINGIKLVHVAGCGLHVKAYLTAFHQVRRPRA